VRKFNENAERRSQESCVNEREKLNLLDRLGPRALLVLPVGVKL